MTLPVLLCGVTAVAVRQAFAVDGLGNRVGLRPAATAAEGGPDVHVVT